MDRESDRMRLKMNASTEGAIHRSVDDRSDTFLKPHQEETQSIKGLRPRVAKNVSRFDGLGRGYIEPKSR